MEVIYQNPELRPTFATEGSVGLDLRADIPEGETIFHFSERKLIKTSCFIRNAKYFSMVCPRSGLALKHGITVANAPGIIDLDYEGEICVILQNLSHDAYTVKHGDRIAQLVFLAPVPQEAISVRAGSATFGKDSERGSGGFGSTGR